MLICRKLKNNSSILLYSSKYRIFQRLEGLSMSSCRNTRAHRKRELLRLRAQPTLFADKRFQYGNVFEYGRGLRQTGGNRLLHRQLLEKHEWQQMESFFIVVFLVELFWRAFLRGVLKTLGDPWNYFDGIIIGVSIVTTRCAASCKDPLG